jgi:hypothetical protein
MPRLDLRRRVGLRPKSVTSSAPQPSSSIGHTAQFTAPHVSSTPSSQVTSANIAASGNIALQQAIKTYLDKIPDAEKKVFQEAAKNISEDNILSKVRDYDNTHGKSSAFRPHAERLSKFLDLLNRFMGGVAIGIQAYPEISSLVVGAVRIIIDLAIGFVTFFSKMTDMLCQFEDYLGPLAEYAKASQDSKLLKDRVANVYGNMLEFCQKARRVFVDTNGEPRKLTSTRLFLRQHWEPFETEFAPIRAHMEHNLNVLLHAAQASQLNDNQEAKQEQLCE